MSKPKISQINFYRQKINVHTITARQTDRQRAKNEKIKVKNRCWNNITKIVILHKFQ